MEGKVKKSPDLLSDGSVMSSRMVIEIQHPQEVYGSRIGRDFGDGRGGPAFMLDDFARVLGETNDSFAENNEGQESESLNKVGVLEGEHTLPEGDSNDKTRFDDARCIPKLVAAVVSVLLEGQGYSQRGEREGQEDPNDEAHRQYRIPEPALDNRPQDRSILSSKNQPARHHQPSYRPKRHKVVSWLIRSKLLVDSRISNHDSKMYRFAYSLKHRVPTKPYVKESHLQPRKPDKSKEANIRPQCYLRLAYSLTAQQHLSRLTFRIINLMIHRKHRQIRNKEQIIEKLDGSRLMLVLEKLHLASGFSAISEWVAEPGDGFGFSSFVNFHTGKRLAGGRLE